MDCINNESIETLIHSIKKEHKYSQLELVEYCGRKLADEIERLNNLLDAIKKAAPSMHWRKCWKCSDLALHTTSKNPKCKLCNSMDTRIVKNIKEWWNC